MTPTNADADTTGDIAWMRALAQEGASAPLRGGSILMAAGLIFGVASIVHWAGVSGLTGLRDEGLGLVWLGATVVFLAVLIVGSVRRGKDGVHTAANRASAVAWSSVGWGIFATFASVGVAASRLGQAGLLLLALVPSIVMVFYGMGWAVSATMTRSRPLWGLAICSFIAAPLLASLSGLDIQYLGYGVCLFLLMALPGFLLMRAAKRV